MIPTRIIPNLNEIAFKAALQINSPHSIKHLLGKYGAYACASTILSSIPLDEFLSPVARKLPKMEQISRLFPLFHDLLRKSHMPNDCQSAGYALSTSLVSAAQEIKDANLFLFFKHLPEEIQNACPNDLLNQPNLKIKAANLRLWIQENRALFQPIEILSLTDRRMTTLPPEINVCSSLQSLCLNNTSILTWPDDVSFPQLEELFLTGTLIQQLPERFPSLCPMLGCLDLTDTPMTALPEPFHFAHLQSLHLTNSPLKEFPADYQLLNLDTLNLDNTQLRKLPEHLNLPALEFLNLGNSRIQRFPANFSLQNLQILYLHYTPLEALPNLFQLPNLNELDLQGTPFEAPEEEETILPPAKRARIDR